MGRSRKFKNHQIQCSYAPTFFTILSFDFLHAFRILAYNTSFSVYSSSSILRPLFDLVWTLYQFFYLTWISYEHGTRTRFVIWRIGSRLDHILYSLFFTFYVITLLFHADLCTCTCTYSGSSDEIYDQTVECGLEMYINSRGQVG
jgi:hypothetical protein